MKEFFKRVSITLAVGLILFVYSEEIFWAFPRVGDTLGDRLFTWLNYCLATYFVIWLIFKYHIRSKYLVFVVGSMYGWFVEGLIVFTMYQELPLSISYTGMAWHSLISVLFGFILFQKEFNLGNTRRIAKLSAYLGIFWGSWGVSWIYDIGYLADYFTFFVNSFFLTSLIILGFYIYNKLEIRQFKPSKIEKILIFGGFLIYFIADIFSGYFIYILTIWIPLQAFSLYLIKRSSRIMTDRPKNEGNIMKEDINQVINRGSSNVMRYPKLGSSITDYFPYQNRSIKVRTLLTLFLIPIIATLVYEGLQIMNLVFAYIQIEYIITVPIGFGFYIIAIIKELKKK
ncbi:MAG: hypothetical protein ACTSVC_11310 [Promethearchaeota archaeon]